MLTQFLIPSSLVFGIIIIIKLILFAFINLLTAPPCSPAPHISCAISFDAVFTLFDNSLFCSPPDFSFFFFLIPPILLCLDSLYFSWFVEVQLYPSPRWKIIPSLWPIWWSSSCLLLELEASSPCFVGIRGSLRQTFKKPIFFNLPFHLLIWF